MSRGKILLSGIRFHGHHGTTPEERAVGGVFAVDFEGLYDFGKASGSDDLSDAVDYAKVFSLILEIGEKQRFNLLETLAERIAHEALERFPLDEVLVRVRKPSPPVEGCLEHFGVEVRLRRENLAQ